MKLDVNVLRYLGKDDFRTLTAVEMGQKNVREFHLKIDSVDLYMYIYIYNQLPVHLLKSPHPSIHGSVA